MSARFSDTTPHKMAWSQDIAQKSEAVIDPDPFGLIFGVIGTVAGVCQIVETVRKHWPKKQPIAKPPAEQFLSFLEDQLHDTIRDVEAVDRFLRGKLSIEGSSVENSEVAFAVAPMGLDISDFSAFERLVQNISLRMAGLNSATLNVIRFDPDLAATIGADILNSFSDIKDRVNGLQKGTNGEALVEALTILREIERIIRRMRGNG